jgi:hypothetical protein
VKERLEMHEGIKKLANEVDVTDPDQWIVVLNRDNGAAMGQMAQHPEIVYALAKMVFRIYRDVEKLDDPAMLSYIRQAFVQGQMDVMAEENGNENNQSRAAG